MNILHIFLTVSFVLIALQSCRKPEETNNEFEEYIDAFLEEGNQRGLNLHRDNISVSIGFHESHSIYAGTCQPWRGEIKINKDFWERATPEIKKWLIFHELGHCVLNREHKNECTAGRESMSWMLGGDENCNINLYSQIWENFYLDELFNTDTPLFWWQRPESHVYPLMAECATLDTFLTNFFEDTIEVRGHSYFLFDIAYENDLRESRFFVVYFDDIKILFCPACKPDQVRIYIKDKRLYSSSVLLPLDKKVKFTIVKSDEVYKFFIGEAYIHTVESLESDRLIIKSRNLDEPTLFTTRFCTN